MTLAELKKLSEAFGGADPEDPALKNKLPQLLLSMGLDPDNLYQELEMESGYVDSHRDISYADSPVNLHSHGFYELIYCRSSSGAEYLLGTERYRLQRGDVVMVPPGISHRPILPRDMSDAYKRYVLWLSREFMAQYFRMYTGDNPSWFRTGGIIRTSGTCWEGLREMFRSCVVESENRHPGWQIAVAGEAMSLLAQLERAAKDAFAPILTAEEPELLDSIIAYAEEHLGEKLTISQVAERFYVSGSTVSHLFRSKLGISFYGLVTQRRLIAAKDLIVKGMGMEEVAVAVGYRDYSSFYRAFRKEYGISPKQFRVMRDAQI